MGVTVWTMKERDKDGGEERSEASSERVRDRGETERGEKRKCRLKPEGIRGLFEKREKKKGRSCEVRVLFL